MRPLVALVFALALLGQADARAAGTRGFADRCSHARARTVAANTQVLVFDRSGYVTACLRRSGHLVRLGPSPRSEACFPDGCDIGPVAVAGALVAYGSNAGGRFGLRDTLIVRDLAKHLVLRRTSAGDFHQEDLGNCSANNESEYTGIGPTSDIALRSDGTVAWIARRICADAQPYEVWLATPRQRARIDRAGAIGPTSLRFTTGTVQWTEDEQSVARSLPPIER